MTPLLKSIIKLAENQEASDLSYLWAGLSGIAAQLARNVYIPFGNGRIYPNLYIMFVGDPGKRKSTAIKDVKSRVKATGYSHFCADSVTMQKYLGDLAGVGEDGEFSANLNAYGTGMPLGLEDYIESYIAQDEFTTFIGVNNYPFIALLGSFWDIDAPYRYRTKTGNSIEIPNPIVNIIGATTPSQFNTIFPPAIAEQGFLSRLIIVNMPTNKEKEHRPKPSCETATREVLEGFREVRQVRGEMVMSEEVWDVLGEIYRGWQPITDSRFAHYSTRRYTQLLKLCMLIAASRYSTSMTVDDVVLANTILAYTEHFMPQALGQFGKNKDGDTNSKVVDYLRSCFPAPRNMMEIYQALSSETDIATLGRIIPGLVAAGKIVSTASGAFLPKISSHLDSKCPRVDWDMLGTIAESKFV